MQFNLEWLKKWVAIDLDAASLADRLTASGLEVDSANLADVADLLQESEIVILMLRPSLLFVPLAALDEITREQMRYELLRIWSAAGDHGLNP